MDGVRMVSSPNSTLTPLQREVLRAFFEREKGFHLTGGAALAGFHLSHRQTDDLDLFTPDPSAFERGRFVLADVASAVGASLEIRQDAPGFLRAAVLRGDEGVVVDLVRDVSPQTATNRLDREGIRVDSPEEILANKLTAIVGRAEERDLVDVYCLERAGFRIEDALAVALAKDGGCTPATLAWLLSEVAIPDGLELPAGIAAAELRAYIGELVKRLRKLAMP
jgi:hypothetical protein